MKKTYNPLLPDDTEKLKGMYEKRAKFLESGKRSLKITTDLTIRTQRMIESNKYQVMRLRMALREKGIGVLKNRRDFVLIDFKENYMFVDLNSLDLEQPRDLEIHEALKRQDENRQKKAIEYSEWLKSIGC